MPNNHTAQIIFQSLSLYFATEVHSRSSGGLVHEPLVRNWRRLGKRGKEESCRATFLCDFVVGLEVEERGLAAFRSSPVSYGNRQSPGQFCEFSPASQTPLPHFGPQSVGLLVLFSPRLTSHTPSLLKGCGKGGECGHSDGAP